MNAYLKKNIKSRVLNGHPWIYDNEIERVSGEPQPGDIVSVYSGKTFVGTGYYNPHSTIRIRILSRINEDINRSFFEQKITASARYRKELFPDETSFRVIFGEGDGLPGLIVDKFSDYLIMQITTLGISRWREDIVNILVSIFQPKGIFEKDDDKSSKKEGIKPIEAWVYGSGPELIPFEMNGILFLADTLGQKTGFFLDQRLNALTARRYADHKNVLDAFSYTGNFGIHALKGNADFVTFIDYSQRALQVLEEILKLNRLDTSRYEIFTANTFDHLRLLEKSGESFDYIILDPPSLAKDRGSKQNALKGYKELNLRAMKLIRDGGLLSTSSCTQIIYEEDFKKVIYSAAENTKKQITILYKGMQSPDHPVVLNIFETEYLKYYVLRVERLRCR
ncbi:MAG: class I SAM-dependent rRNA methyltransferase [Proteobacteria bacterium]|nr:class I SAM-dependent rRNA methyltransferase [Pseudomonadota bacterium]